MAPADVTAAQTTTVPPTAERISSFRSYIRRRAADDATATAASAADTLATPPSPDVNVDVNEGATASAYSAATVSFVSSDISVFSSTAASAAETLVTPPFPGVSVDATEGATANAASAAVFSFGSSDISVFPPPATDDATMPTASVAATLADSPFPDMAMGTADGATATAASDAGTLATPSSPDVNVDVNEGATASADSAATVSFVSSDISVFFVDGCIRRRDAGHPPPSLV